MRIVWGTLIAALFVATPAVAGDRFHSPADEIIVATPRAAAKGCHGARHCNGREAVPHERRADATDLATEPRARHRRHAHR